MDVQLHIHTYIHTCTYIHTYTHTYIGLAHLCEFIEDCEHVELATKILHLLGREGPRASKPYKYIRFIYNRVLLESAPVRAGKDKHPCIHNT